ncbi:MAG: EAL domain-containing protein [Christensenellales bacterium]|jgi:diguanylate cyclase (GGDEF)-like protein
MLTPADIFSVILITAAGVSFMFGLYIFKMRRKMRRAQKNALAFAVAIALTIWALGLGQALSAPTKEVSVLWRRIAGLGWGTFYSFLLHFLLVLTNHKPTRKTWWLLLPIYLPAALNILVFTIPTQLNPMPYNMVETPLGWTNVAEYNAWDIYFVAFYISAVLTGIVIVWRWGLKSSDENIRKQSKLLFVTCAVALLLGTLTDMLANALLVYKIPQMAPLWVLIPISGIYISMRRYGFMNIPQPNSGEEILSASARKKLYRNVTLALLVGSGLLFFTQYVINPDGRSALTLVLSAGFLAAGAGVYIVSRLKLSNRQKDFINIMGLALSIPVIVLCYVEYGSITVWAYPFLLMFVALVFDRRVVLGNIAFLALLTQALVWMIKPRAVVVVDETAYITRIGIFAIGVALASFVNKIYISRLQQNADQISLQTMISDISSDFVTANQDNIREKMAGLLAKAGTFFGVDRAYVCFLEGRNRTPQLAQMWNTEGHADVGAFQTTGIVPWWVQDIRKREVVQITDYTRKSADMGEAAILGVTCRSLLAIPVVTHEKVLGFLAFENVKAIRTWKDEHVNLLKVLANILADAKAKAEAEKEIQMRAFYDHLTGLSNRYLFKEKLNQALLDAARTGRKVGVIFLDLDSFKAVNDTMGHERGDELLRMIANRLRKCVRKSDAVSRFGGDEFLLMINNLVHENDIVKVADKIMEMFRNPLALKGQEYYITASAGIAMYPVDGQDANRLIKNADIAMYSAKEAGKNRYAMCSHEMKEAINTRVALTTNLYRALDRGELVLYYQPQISLQTQRIIGMEALLRWKSPEYGLVSPTQFIPLAEQTGLINPIGEWVLMEACRQNKTWQDAGLPLVRMSVNLSVIQLRNPRLKEIVRDTLEATGLEPRWLELEITESVAMRESDYIVGLLSRLKTLGVTLSIDDFGTEYSSLSRLKTLPVDRIKMDMQYVRGIDESEKDQAITKVIINLAKSLGLKVIAEGVETESQMNFLYQRMCDEVQGYYYYQPMPADEAEQVLRENMLKEVQPVIG